MSSYPILHKEQPPYTRSRLISSTYIHLNILCKSKQKHTSPELSSHASLASSDIFGHRLCPSYSFPFCKAGFFFRFLASVWGYAQISAFPLGKENRDESKLWKIISYLSFLCSTPLHDRRWASSRNQAVSDSRSGRERKSWLQASDTFWVPALAAFHSPSATERRAADLPWEIISAAHLVLAPQLSINYDLCRKHLKYPMRCRAPRLPPHGEGERRKTGR